MTLICLLWTLRTQNLTSIYKQRDTHADHWCFHIAEHELFSAFVIFGILVNTLVLATDHYGISDGLLCMLDLTNVVLTFVFFVEMCIKLIGYGFKGFAQERMNLFDAGIVFITMSHQSLLFYKL